MATMRSVEAGKTRVGLNLAVLCVFLLAGLAEVGACPRMCHTIYEPVCGSDGTTYSHRCYLGLINCRNPSQKIVVAHEGRCIWKRTTVRACPELCPAVYRPVCGSNGQNYTNECFLNMDSCNNPSQNITIAHKGRCIKRTTEVGACPHFCSDVYLPVCGSNGKTYRNKCYLELDSCNNPSQNIVVAYKGPCIKAEVAACPCGCLAVYDPVCGSNGKTYSNECELDRDSCKNPCQRIVVAYNGTCIKSPAEVGPCPEGCYTVYRPVCGSNGKTYSNKCFLEMDSCKKPSQNIAEAHKGECIKSTVKVAACPCGCLAVYDPVCGSNGRTYSNKCHLLQDSCKNPCQNIFVAHNGPCIKTTEGMRSGVVPVSD